MCPRCAGNLVKNKSLQHDRRIAHGISNQGILQDYYLVTALREENLIFKLSVMSVDHFIIS